MRKSLSFLALLCLFFYLLSFPAQALYASRAGLQLWFQTLLPTLLPFLILSNILIQANLIPKITGWLSPLFRRLLGISSSGAYALLTGFLCGYPVGAKVLAQLEQTGQIPRLEAEYLLSFCNNASPAFLITFLVAEQKKRPDLTLISLGLIYGSPLLYGVLKNPSFRRKTRQGRYPLFVVKKAPTVQITFELIDACIMDAVITITKLGAYIILFSILAGIIDHLPLLPEGTKAVCIGLTEITNGIAHISEQYPLTESFPLLMALTTFGGFSSIAQTESVTCEARFSMHSYVSSKIITALLAGAGAMVFRALV